MTLQQVLDRKLSYNDVEAMYDRGIVSQDTFEAYQEVWAYAGEWFHGRFVYYHVSDFAERLRAHIERDKQGILIA